MGNRFIGAATTLGAGGAGGLMWWIQQQTPAPWLIDAVLIVSVLLVIASMVYWSLAFFDWRRKSTTPTTDRNLAQEKNMTAWAAIDYILDESEMGKNFTGAIKGAAACQVFCRAAEQAELSVEGRKKLRPDTEEIPHTYWRTAMIDLIKYLSHRAGRYEDSDGGETAIGRSEIVPTLFVTYVGLRVDEKEVKKLWPTVNT